MIRKPIMAGALAGAFVLGTWVGWCLAWGAMEEPTDEPYDS